jgi:hypothetical protein
MDVRGDRFLNRFAGSDDFQHRLNRSKNAPSRSQANTPGDFTRQSASSSDSMGGDYSAPSYGPNFDTQVNREKTLQAEQQNKDSQASTDIFNKYATGNRMAQAGRSDGSSIANKYINSAKESNPIDIVALDKHIRRGPMYHEAKSELAGLLTFGDKYRNAREGNMSWAQPDPMKGVEKPDFESIYDRTKDDIDDIDI